MRLSRFLKRSSVGSLRISAGVSIPSLESCIMKAIFCKFSPISRDLEIFTLPSIVRRVKRSRLVFIAQAFRAQSAHYYRP